MGPAASAAAAPGGVLGVLGGMGPRATIDFMHKVMDATPARRDQDHVPMIVSSIPQVPDRAAAFRGEGASPLAAMIESGRRLAQAGAGMLVVPCNTAHLWFEGLQKALALPMLHLVDAALEDALAATAPGAPLGLLCTDATLASGLYMNRSPTGDAKARVQWVLPTAREMLELVMPGIDAVKAGELDEARALLGQAAELLVRRGACALVLGCTEVPLALDASTTTLPLIDATASLARRAVSWSLAERRLVEA